MQDLLELNIKPYLIAVHSKDPVKIKEILEMNGFSNEPYYITEEAVERVPSIMWLDGEIKTGGPEKLFNDPFLKDRFCMKERD